MSGNTLPETLQALTGRLGEQPVGELPYVAVVPDDYLPPLKFFGPAGSGVVAAGGAGTRSEIALILASPVDPDLGVRVYELYVGMAAAALSFEIVRVASVAGFTDVPFFAGDCGNGKSKFRVQTKNTAAATASIGSILATGLSGPQANGWIKVPGEIILRARPNANAVVVRSKADQQAIQIMCAYQQLAKRKL